MSNENFTGWPVYALNIWSLSSSGFGNYNNGNEQGFGKIHKTLNFHFQLPQTIFLILSI